MESIFEVFYRNCKLNISMLLSGMKSKLRLIIPHNGVFEGVAIVSCQHPYLPSNGNVE